MDERNKRTYDIDQQGQFGVKADPFSFELCFFFVGRAGVFQFILGFVFIVTVFLRVQSMDTFESGNEFVLIFVETPERLSSLSNVTRSFPTELSSAVFHLPLVFHVDER